MKLDGYAGYGLPIKKLKGTEPVESLDLSGRRVRNVSSKAGSAWFFDFTSAIVIASLIGINASLTRVDVKDNRLGEEGEAAICKACEGRSGFELLL